MIALRQLPTVSVMPLSGPPTYSMSVAYECRLHQSPLGIRAFVPRPSMRAIARKVADESGYTMDDLVGPSHVRAVAHARQRAMYEIYATGFFSLPQIGRLLGGRDHTTILYGCRVHADRHGLPQIVGKR